jgi:hypothetical protein
MGKTWSVEINLGDAIYDSIRAATKEEAILEALEMMHENPRDALPSRYDVNSDSIKAYAR